jgi:hypothetical protein
MKAAKKPRGRPPKAPEKGRRQNYTFRLHDETRERLVKSAAAANRSLSEEIEWRVEQLFQWEQAFGDIQTMLAQAKEITEGGLDAALRRAKYIPNQTSKGMAYFENWDVMVAYTRPSIDTVKQAVAEALKEVGFPRPSAEEDKP